VVDVPIYCMRPRLFEQLREWFRVVHPDSVQLDGSLRLDCLLLPADHYVDEPEVGSGRHSRGD
jgi:hypothetical protein